MSRRKAARRRPSRKRLWRGREREELKKCLDYVREGDTLMVTKLDRLARSAADLYAIVATLEGKGGG